MYIKQLVSAAAQRGDPGAPGAPGPRAPLPPAGDCTGPAAARLVFHPGIITARPLARRPSYFQKVHAKCVRACMRALVCVVIEPF